MHKYCYSIWKLIPFFFFWVFQLRCFGPQRSVVICLHLLVQWAYGAHICVWHGRRPATRMIDLWPIFVCIWVRNYYTLENGPHMSLAIHTLHAWSTCLWSLNMDKYSGNYQFVKFNLHQSWLISVIFCINLIKKLNSFWSSYWLPHFTRYSCSRIFGDLSNFQFKSRD